MAPELPTAVKAAIASMQAQGGKTGEILIRFKDGVIMQVEMKEVVKV